MNSLEGSQIDYEVVVVGGGIAGLVALWTLRDRQALLLEADERVGGRIKSVQHGEYWANLGAQVYPHADSHMGKIGAELGLNVREIKGSLTAIGLRDRITNVARPELLPFVLKLTLRERVAMIRAGLKVMKGIRDINRIEHRVPTSEQEEQEQRIALTGFEWNRTFADYVRGATGSVRALFECISRRTAADLDEVSAGAALLVCAHVMGPKDAAAATAGVVMGGTEQVVHGLRERLSDQIVTSAPVTRVTDRGDHVVVTYESEGATRQVTARTVVVATPAHITRQVVEAIPADLDAALGSITYGMYLSMGIFTDEHTPLSIDDVYAITTPGHEIDFLFNHAQILRDGERRKSGGSLMCYRGGPRAVELGEESDEVIRDTFLRSVYELIPELRGHVVKTVVQRWPLGNVYGAPGQARKDAQAVFEHGFGHDRIVLAGEYFEPISGMEPAARAAVRAAEQAVRGLTTLSAG
ncbi:FAD-dependent oxidoreductase [Sphaerisporangium sp. NPDC051011]|uniref:flavin monoamine oxidase family protein n=1 Tax=Sphaerisporangium sp. NPDC051011 TaxID=3155792 RepID=UPI0033C8D591